MHIQVADLILGRFYCLAAAFFFTICLYFIRECKVSAINVNMIRGIGDILIVYFQARIQKKKLFDNWKCCQWSLFRTVFGSISIVGLAIASKLIKISIYAVICRLQGVLLTFLGIIYLGNKFDYRIVIAAFVCLFGVTLVIAPSIYGFKPGRGGDLSLTWTLTEIIGVIMSLVVVFAESFSLLILTKASGFVNSVQSIQFLNIGICLLNGFILLWNPTGFEFHWNEVPYYLGVIFGYWFGQIAYTESAKREKNVGIQGILQSSSVIYALLIDVAIFGVKVSGPNMVGCLIVVVSSIYAVMLREHK